MVGTFSAYMASHVHVMCTITDIVSLLTLPNSSLYLQQGLYNITDRAIANAQSKFNDIYNLEKIEYDTSCTAKFFESERYSCSAGHKVCLF
jgi:hypothetical protein